jgi:hypothetical protein
MKIPEGKQRELIAAGTYNAILVQVLDIGTQPSNNPKFKPSRRVLLGFEILGESTEEGDPFILFKNYNFTNNDSSALMKDLTAWLALKDSANFELDNALGKPAQITVTHSDDGKYANILTVTGLVKGTKVGKSVTAMKSLYLDPDTFDVETFNALGDKHKAKIAATPEYALAVAPKVGKKKVAAAAPAKKGKK